MAEKTKEEPANQSKSLTDSDTSDDTKVNPRCKTSVEERQYNTIPGSVTATRVALRHSRYRPIQLQSKDHHDVKSKRRSLLQRKPKIDVVMLNIKVNNEH